MEAIADRARNTRPIVSPIPFVVLTIALAVTLAVTLYLKVTIESADELRFQVLADQAVDSIGRRMEEQIGLLRHSAGLLSIHPSLTRKEFREYVERIQIDERYPGVRGIGYAVKVAPGEEAKLEAFARSQGLADFKIHPAQWKGDVYAILYLEPLDGPNRRALGFNMYSEPNRRAAMDRAAVTGEAIATIPVQLVQYPRESARNSFLVYVPVYKSGAAPRTAEERKKNLIGFAYSPFKGVELLAGIYPLLPPSLRIELYDGLAKPASMITQAPDRDSDYRSRHTAPHKFLFGGREWTIVIKSTRQFDASSDRRILPFVASIGLVASVLLFGLSLSQQRSRLEAEQYAERVREAADTQQFLVQAGTILAASIEYEETLSKVAQLTVPRLADWCSVSVLEPSGNLKLVALAHADPTKAAWGRSLSEKYSGASEDSVARKVLATGEPVLLPEISEEMLQSAATGEDHLEILRQLGMRSAIVVPLSARGKGIGTLTLVSTSAERRYGQKDLELAEQLAARAALAVDNSRLFRDLQQELAERQRAEGEVRTLNAVLEQRVEERTRDLRVSNAELEAFSYSVSHDLRAPLRSVSAFASILREDLADTLDEDSLDHLNRLDRAARRMGQLIDSLLQYSRLARREIRTEKVDVTALSDTIAGELRDRYPERNIEIKVQPSMCAQADPVLLRVVLENLLENAVKFTAHRNLGVIEVGQALEGEMAFFVRDNGAGFDEQYANKLFRPFERLHKDSEFPGTGIGLANVRRVVERHGGRVWAEGKIDQGATIYFTLPGEC